MDFVKFFKTNWLQSRFTCCLRPFCPFKHFALWFFWSFLFHVITPSLQIHDGARGSLACRLTYFWSIIISLACQLLTLCGPDRSKHARHVSLRCCIPHDQTAQNSVSSPSKNRWIEEILIISSEEHIYLPFYNSSLISHLGFRTELYFVLPSVLETSYKPRVDVTRVLRKWMDLVSFLNRLAVEPNYLLV